MLTRTPITAPVPCYGLEKIEGNSRCLACPHAEGCAEVMGSRLARVPVNQATFCLTPARLKSPPKQSAESFHYCRAYFTIFSENCPAPPEEVLAGCAQNSLTVCADFYMFCLVNMWAHYQVNPTRKFWATMLAGPAAINRFVRYQQDVIKSYGAMSLSTFSQYTCVETLEGRMLRSEIDAGSWILGYKLKKGGPFLAAFIETKELDLDNSWLATTPEYEDFLLAWFDKKVGTAVQIRKRGSVGQELGNLKKVKSAGASAFSCRERIMPEAIKTVLANLGFQPSLFLARKGEKWDSTLKFWARLALAVQQIRCLNYVNRQSKNLGLELPTASIQ